MLGSFQKLYPTGCLVSELVQIYNGKYVVKASLQVEGVIRTTGMAAAEVIEEAEDRARERALAIFGTVETVTQEPAVPSNAIAPSKNSTPNTDITLNISTISAPVEASLETSNLETSNLEKSNPIIATETESSILKDKETQKIDVPEPDSQPNLQPNLVPQLSSVSELEEVPAPAKSNSSSKTKTTAAIKDINRKNSNKDLTQDLSQDLNQDLNQQTNQTLPVNQPESLPETFPETLLDIPLESLAAPEPAPEQLPLAGLTGANATTSNVMQFTPRNYIPPTEIEPEPVEPEKIENPPAPEANPVTTSKRNKKTQPEDNSDDIAKIGVEMQRLHWTTEQGRDYLFQTYRKKSRHSLTPDELRSFRKYLESQPTPEDPLAIDPIAGF